MADPKKPAAAAAHDDRDPAIDEILMNAADFAKLGGEDFGGESSILLLEKDEVAGPLTYLDSVEQNLGLGMIEVHRAKDKKDKTWRLPIAANFRQQAETADLRRGDVFFIQRVADVQKKKGAGAGNMMEMYKLKVTNRAPRQATV